MSDENNIEVCDCPRCGCKANFEELAAGWCVVCSGCRVGVLGYDDDASITNRDETKHVALDRWDTQKKRIDALTKQG